MLTTDQINEIDQGVQSITRSLGNMSTRRAEAFTANYRFVGYYIGEALRIDIHPTTARPHAA